jgi:uncharacterized protein
MKVDELISNIRKSVDSDIDSLTNGTSTQARGTLMRGALREMRISMTADQQVAPPKPSVKEDISDLRNRIRQRMAAMEADPFAAAPKVVPPTLSKAVVPMRSDFSGIMAGGPRLRPSFAEEEPREEVRYAPPPQEWHEPQSHAGYAEQEHYQQPDDYADHYGYAEQGYATAYQPALESPIVSPQTQAHTESAFQQLSDAILSRATGDKSLEEMTRDMLRGMLKQWLDANLPAIVEDMVREEIQRVARRGR